MHRNSLSCEFKPKDGHFIGSGREIAGERRKTRNSIILKFNAMMKNNQKIKETLSEGYYLIPEGYKATVHNGMVEISVKRDNRIKDGDWRCKDCKHRIEGRASINAYFPSYVCALKPKQVRNTRFASLKLYYCANRNDKACGNFERKDG